MFRILLAEDDDVMRDYLTRALERSGYEVTAASDGGEAWTHLESGTYDLLLSDIVMPEMDGIELAQRAQAMPNPPKVMFITGFAAVAVQATAEVANARTLSKPFHLKDLVQEVGMLLSSSGRQGSI